MPNAFTKHAAASAPVSASIAPLNGKHEPHKARRRAEALQQRLVGEPFADETVQRRQRGNGHRADQKKKRRPAHPFRQSAHFLHVARVRGVQHRARAEEQQRL